MASKGNTLVIIIIHHNFYIVFEVVLGYYFKAMNHNYVAQTIYAITWKTTFSDSSASFSQIFQITLE